jgi:protein O-GlcNAc transferase
MSRMIQRAMSFHREGRLADAEPLYRAALAKKPRQFQALHFLGVLKLQQGNAAEAIGLISAALELEPKAAEAVSSLGAALSMLNRHEEALTVYDRLLRVKPADVDALYNRGVTLSRMQRHAEALESFERVLAIRADHVLALYNRGNALAALGRDEQALESYDRLLVLLPRNVDALNNRGNVLARLGRSDEALACYDGALALQPNHLDALNNRGNAFKALGRYEEALASYDRVLALKPDHAGALNNRGNALLELKRYEEALESYGRALAARPNDPDLLFHSARALQEVDLHDRAATILDKVIEIDPANADALYSRGASRMELNRIAEAVADYEAALTLEPDHPHVYSALLRSHIAVCDWDRVEGMAGELQRRLEDGKTIIEPFHLLCLPSKPVQQLKCAQNYVRSKAADMCAPAWPPAGRTRDKLRIGYFSGDFRRHVVASAIAELFELHDRTRFEIFGISFGPDDCSDLRSRIVNSFDQFHDVRSRGDREIAKLMHDLGIDIAVDLTGHTKHSRTEVLAYRPCPIQVSFLGYPGTSGAEFIDYILGDATVLPFERQAFFAEKIVHLPHCYLPNDSRERTISPQVPNRGELGLPEHGFVFCAFTNSYKIAAPVFEVWMRLLRAVEGSVLWLSRMSRVAAGNLEREAAARGVDPSRLVFAPRLDSFADHLARHSRADLYLDTLPYNAHTTAANALWAGLPVLTCTGDGFAGRVGASALRAAGLPELVTGSLEEYEALARRLAGDPALLQSFRRRLQRHRLECPLFDPDGFRRAIEAAYLTMWKIHERGENPRCFAVDSD